MLELAIEMALWGGLVPAVVAIVVIAVSHLVLPADVAQRCAGALGFAAAFFVGFALLPRSWAPLKPSGPWHWLPYLGCAAAVVGPIGLASGVRLVERWAISVLLAIVAAWLLVPLWPKLEPTWRYVGGLAAGIVLLSILLSPLPGRISPRWFLAVLAAVAGATTGCITYFFSLKYGQVAAASAGALMGCAVAALRSNDAGTARGVLLTYAVVVGGISFTAYLDAFFPAVPLLAMPAAPLALWLCAAGPLAQMKGGAALAAQIVVVALPLAACVVLLLLGEAGKI